MLRPAHLILPPGFQDTSTDGGESSGSTQTPSPSEGETGTSTGSDGSTDTPTKAAPEGGGMMGSLVLFGGMFLLLWLFLLGPERRKRKQHQEQMNKIREKDDVMTLGGIFGTVTRIDGDQITIRVDEKRGSTLRIARSSIASILSREGQEQEASSS